MKFSFYFVRVSRKSSGRQWLHNELGLPPTGLSDKTIKEIDNLDSEFTCK